MKHLLVVLFLASYTPTSHGKETKAVMRDFLNHMMELKKYINSEEKFLKPENDAEIRKNLKGLADTAKDAVHDPQLKKVGYSVSREVLEEHFKEAERIYRLGNKRYARWMLNSALGICVSCHTQLPSQSRTWVNDLELGQNFASDFDQAEFYFATRAFDKASNLFHKIITGYPANKVKTEDLETALERQLAYYARVKRSPTLGLERFEQYQKLSKAPEYLEKNIRAWAALFREWKKENPLDPRFATEEQIQAYAEKSLSKELWDKMVDAENPRLVTYLKLSGILYEYLQLNPKSKLIPNILYWLAICDRNLKNNFFYSLADVYLKECIVKYPKSKVAKDCYKEYEENLIASYSGSSGTNIPPDVEADLAKLKKLVK